MATHICKARALYSFPSTQPTDLGFNTGDIILVTRKIDGMFHNIYREFLLASNFYLINKLAGGKDSFRGGLVYFP